MEEIWKPIEGSGGLYEVSNLGRVMSHCNYGGVENRILKQRNDKDGYLIINLKGIKGSNHKVHRLVAEAFIENTNNYPMINHKDENKQNNCVDNLEWCDAKYNNTYGHRLDCLPVTWKKWSYTSKARQQMSEVGKSRAKRCAAYKDGVLFKEFESTREAGKFFNTCQSNIARCCATEKGKAKGYTWKYL